MKDTFKSKLAALAFKMPNWCIRPSEALVRGFEQRFSLSLPSDYRDFLLHYGGMIGDAAVDFEEPTPCGPATCVDTFYGFTSSDRTDNVVDATELIDGFPAVVAIGSNLFGAMFWLKCTGWDAGHIYMHDHEGRFAWPDRMFYKMYANISPDIERYLAVRAEGALPKKPGGYEHVYKCANSFTEFIDKLRPVEEKP